MSAPEPIYDWRKVTPDAILPVLIYGDLHLRQKASKVTTSSFSADPASPLRQQLRQLAATADVHDGVAIAAPQVGILDQILVIGGSLTSNGFPVSLINPEISDQAVETVYDVEGCLSFPGARVTVPRPIWIRVKAQNPSGESFVIKAHGLLARVICHEMEHLQGRLLIDHVEGLKRKMIEAKMRKLRRRMKRMKGQ